jgi:hypothetical protein
MTFTMPEYKEKGMKKARQSKLQLFMALIMAGLLAVPIAAQTTAFTYQGKLTDAGSLANGTYDMQFKLFDTVTVATGTQQGVTITNSTVQVTNGIFAVNLDFGTNVFTGAARYLEISVRPAGSPNPHTVLSPRQQITSSPYAIQTVNAQQLGGLPANRYVATDTNGNVGIGTPSPSTRLDVVNPASQLRFGPTTADNGGYLVSTLPSEAIIAGGAKWDGANWIARDTAASMTAHHFGAIRFFTNDNLIVGSPFNPTQRMLIESNGSVNIGGGCCGLARLTVFTPSGNYGILHGDGTVAISSYIHPAGAGYFGTLTNHPLRLTINGNPRMTLDTGGNVGIGTVTPSTKLEVVDPVRQLRFGPTTADNGGYLISTVPHQAIIIGGAKFDGTDWIARDTSASFTAHHFGAIQFFTNSNLSVGGPYSPSARMTIDVNGNVGIGTTTPGYRLDVIGGVRSLDSISTHFVAQTTGGTNSWARYFMRTPNRGWFIGTSQNFNGDQFYIWDETANQIRMAITTGGYVGIGTTTPGAKLHVVDAGSVATVRGTSTDGVGVSGESTNLFGVYGTSANSWAGYFSGNVYVSGTVTQGSDARLKQNISTLGYGLTQVLRLRPVSWRWKEHPERGQQLGLIAQEVEPVLPELVTTAKDAEQMKGLNYTGLIPVLVKAIQEQQQQLEQYRTQLAQQQARERQQQQEMAAIKKLLCTSQPQADLCKAK